MFMNHFSKLKSDDKIKIINLMRRMEHTTPLEKINIKIGIELARIGDMDLSLKELLNNVMPEYTKAQGYICNDLSILDTYHTMIRRNSRNTLYKILLKYLCIDESFIQECYFNSLNEIALFNSLLPKDQNAILWYIENIYEDQNFAIRSIPLDLGTESDE